MKQHSAIWHTVGIMGKMIDTVLWYYFTREISIPNVSCLDNFGVTNLDQVLNFINLI